MAKKIGKPLFGEWFSWLAVAPLVWFFKWTARLYGWDQIGDIETIREADKRLRDEDA